MKLYKENLPKVFLSVINKYDRGRDQKSDRNSFLEGVDSVDVVKDKSANRKNKVKQNDIELFRAVVLNTSIREKNSV